MSSNTPNSSEQVQSLLGSKPGKKTSFIYQAIIVSLSIHIFVLGITYLLSVPPLETIGEESDEAIEEIELSFEEPETELPVPDPMEGMSEEVKNLLANAQSVRTSDRVNYTAKSQEEINAEVYQQLKGLEKAEYDQLKSGRPDNSIKDNVNDPKEKAKDDKNASKENYDWYKNQSQKSYAGPVSAEFSLQGRSVKSSPKPTYRCKTSGKVIIKIEVNQAGEVTNAAIDERSTANDCIREESLAYAKKWKFDYNEKAPKKQAGTITFTFSQQ